jgi:hypothetical protein
MLIQLRVAELNDAAPYGRLIPMDRIIPEISGFSFGEEEMAK